MSGKNSHVKLTDRIVGEITQSIGCQVSKVIIKVQTIVVQAPIRLIWGPNKVTHRLTTTEPFPVPLGSDIKATSPPVIFYTLRFLK